MTCRAALFLVSVVAMLASTAARADYQAGVRQFDRGDYVGAADAWRDAALSGDLNARFQLGRLYEEGLGVPQSYVHAHAWYNLAAALGHPEARAARDTLAGGMTGEQIAAAQTLAVQMSSGAPASSDPSVVAAPTGVAKSPAPARNGNDNPNLVPNVYRHTNWR